LVQIPQGLSHFGLARKKKYKGSTLGISGSGERARVHLVKRGIWHHLESERERPEALSTFARKEKRVEKDGRRIAMPELTSLELF
jgi:hypothetical protein